MTMGNASTILRRCLIGFALIIGACVALAIIYFLALLTIGYRMESSEPYDPRASLRAAAPEWTPDGSRIVFGHEGSVYVVNQDGSALSRIHGSDGEDDLYHTPILSGDGSWIGYSKYQGDERWERLSSALDGSDIRETSEDLDRGFTTFPSRDPYSVSPDRSRIAFVEVETRGENGRQATVLYVSENPKETDRSGWTELAEGDAIHSPRWSPDGSQLAFVKLNSFPYNFSSYRYTTQVVALNGSDLGPAHQVADGLGRSGYHDVAWSPNGMKLLISDTSSIIVVNVDGSDLRTLVKLQDSPIRELHPSWSPDGSKIAVYNGDIYWREPFTKGALFTMSPDGSNKRVLTEYGVPLRLAQNQTWDPAFDATPTPSVTPSPTPAPSATPKPATATPTPRAKSRAPASTPTPRVKPRAPASTPTPSHGIAPPTTRADAPGGAKDPRAARDIGGFDPTAPIRGGAAYGHRHVPTPEDVLESGLYAAGATPNWVLQTHLSATMISSRNPASARARRRRRSPPSGFPPSRE